MELCQASFPRRTDNSQRSATNFPGVSTNYSRPSRQFLPSCARSPRHAFRSQRSAECWQRIARHSPRASVDSPRGAPCSPRTADCSTTSFEKSKRGAHHSSVTSNWMERSAVSSPRLATNCSTVATNLPRLSTSEIAACPCPCPCPCHGQNVSDYGPHHDGTKIDGSPHGAATPPSNVSSTHAVVSRYWVHTPTSRDVK
jgi:hypothetical protein